MILSLVCSSSLANSKVISIRLAAPELPPLIYTNESGEIVGFIADKLKEVNQKGDIKFSITILPWARGIEEVKSGSYDAILPSLFTNERQEYLTYPKQPLINFHGNVLLKRSDDDFVFHSLESIGKSKVIAKVRAIKLDTTFSLLNSENKLNVIEVNRLSNAMQMLELGRVDFVISDAIVAYNFIEKQNIKNKVIAIQLSTKVTPSYIAFSRQFSLINDIDLLMNKINKINNPDSYHQKLVITQ
jgi:polar amino acid transport system substrate-binding protein